jgi:hypothetical protein
MWKEQGGSPSPAPGRKLTGMREQLPRLPPSSAPRETPTNSRTPPRHQLYGQLRPPTGPHRPARPPRRSIAKLRSHNPMAPRPLRCPQTYPAKVAFGERPNGRPDAAAREARDPAVSARLLGLSHLSIAPSTDDDTTTRTRRRDAPPEGRRLPPARRADLQAACDTHRASVCPHASDDPENFEPGTPDGHRARNG